MAPTTTTSAVRTEVQESTIRRMTRLAHKHQAINLSQGYPNEPPPWDLRLALAHAVLTGRPEMTTDPSDNTQTKDEATNGTRESLLQILRQEPTTTSGNGNNDDILNQYSPPMGRTDLRQAVATYYERIYNYPGIQADSQVTITLGATEAVACALRSVCRPGDGVVILEPFHELYPSQCGIFYLEPNFVRLRAEEHHGWKYDPVEIRSALQKSKALLLNTPHNPTGKVFSYDELHQIVGWCLEFEVYIITDEIYEHMCYHPEDQHYLLPQTFPQIADRVLVCNSLGKSASATGWRLGWCLHPPHLSATYRGIHDQLTVMSPHPVQYAALVFFQQPRSFFRPEIAERYRKRVQLLVDLVTAAGFQVIVAPAAAYYVMVAYDTVPQLCNMEPLDAALYMVENVGVACVPAGAFYATSAPRYLRLAACRTESDLREAGRRLQEHLG